MHDNDGMEMKFLNISVFITVPGSLFENDADLSRICAFYYACFVYDMFGL